MPNGAAPVPRLIPGIMLSSTFTDLEKHRAALIGALKGQELTDIPMENDTAKADVDLIDSSLQMVQRASAYIGIISRKYGQTPQDPNRNPNELSITELEFNEAQRLDRPILLFIMGPDHPLKEADFETDPVKREKLNAFRERAKQMKPGSPVHRVYAAFNSLEEFTQKAIHAAAGLRRYLDEIAHPAPDQHTAHAPPESQHGDPIPKPPALYAEPRYIGSHQFIGRRAQLDILNDWAIPADAHPVLLFDAIGGAGKSMLTWEWITNQAPSIRADWAGCFWYSFYERGAIMADFCRRALAYITGEPLDSFNKVKTPELGERLLHHLQDRPWLLVLDGIERVLVAYQRSDAAQLADEEANQPTDQIAHRDPCTAIRHEDDDLLRALAAAAPSKLLITSRLVPRVLLNAANQPIPGVLRVSLPGLRPADAEALLRSCGITGDSQSIQTYLKSHCDCHPLVTGILAGLMNDYLPDKGNFDAWSADASDGGGRLNLANLDLVQKRNHILQASLEALPEKSRQLLSTLALLSESVDYSTLSALNPHLPPEPEEVGAPPDDPKSWSWWKQLSRSEKEKEQRDYRETLKRRKEYEQAVEARLHSPGYLAAPRELAHTVRDLERRGLLQYDANTRRYDLHPVVRGIAAGRLRPEESNVYGQRVVDYFSERPHSPYDQAETLDEVHDGLSVVRTLLKMGRYQQACDVYRGDLGSALHFNLEAHPEALSLLKPFFPQGWATLPKDVDEGDGTYLANDSAIALERTGALAESLDAAAAALASDLRTQNWRGALTALENISETYRSQNHLAQAERCILSSLRLAELIGDGEEIFAARNYLFGQLAIIGQWDKAKRLWDLLDPMGRDWSRAAYRPGDAEHCCAVLHFWQGDLTEVHLARAEELARTGKNRQALRAIHALRGDWRIEQSEWKLAVESLGEAVSMARAAGQTDARAETRLALAKLHLGQLADPRREAEQLASASTVDDCALGELWLAIGDHEQAKTHALAAYKWAWADGEPYVYRYDLNKARALLEILGAEIPNLPVYDPAKDGKFPLEDEVAAAIEKLRAEKEAKNRKQD
jgi:hypothetical protein